jgi:hypothetical protein
VHGMSTRWSRYAVHSMPTRYVPWQWNAECNILRQLSCWLLPRSNRASKLFTMHSRNF